MDVTQLHGRAVVALADATKIGQVDEVVLDDQYQRVVGFRIKHAQFTKGAGLLREQVIAIGPDALTIAQSTDLQLEEQVSALQQGVPLSRVTGTKVVTQGGELLGTIAGVEVDDTVQQVIAYTLASSLVEKLLQQTTTIAASDVMQVGTGGIMMVHTPVA